MDVLRPEPNRRNAEMEPRHLRYLVAWPAAVA
jgi:hypothetical protein